MADKKKKTTKKKSSSKKAKASEKDAAATPELEENVEPETADAEAKVNETPKKSGDRSRVWYVQPKQAASLKTSRGTLIKGRPKPIVEGSPDYEFYKRRGDVLLTSKG